MERFPIVRFLLSLAPLWIPAIEGRFWYGEPTPAPQRKTTAAGAFGEGVGDRELRKPVQ